MEILTAGRAMFFGGWLMFGLLVALAVLLRASQTTKLNRFPLYRNLFFLAIVLGGPLLFLVVIFVPTATVQRYATAWRARLETRTPRLTFFEKRRIRAAQREVARTQEALRETEQFKRYDKALRQIGGARE